MSQNKSLLLLLIIIPAVLLATCVDSEDSKVEDYEAGADNGGPLPDRYTWEPTIPAEGDFVLRETTTGSIFTLSGEAIRGPLADSQRALIQVPGATMFWFAWSIFNPGSEIWGRNERVADGDLPADKSGYKACGGGLDCIPSLPNTGPPIQPIAWTEPDAEDADYIAEDDLVLGIFYDGVPRAYPHNILWWHEIVNDQLADRRFTIAFCPLTSSGLAWSAMDKGYTFGVSSFLFNSNLIMYDHQTENFWSQLWMGGVKGSEKGTWLEQMPVYEMTWAKWKRLHPDTAVLSDNTGHSRNYLAYPYGDYRTDNEDTFSSTTPDPDPMYPNKQPVLGLANRETGAAKVYVHSDLKDNLGDRAVIDDTFDNRPIVVLYESDANFATAFYRDTEDGVLSFEVATW
jgi:uncharacterized protein DUF3179